MATVKVVAPIKSVQLTLSEQEAKTLLVVTENVGGDPKLSRRKHMTAICNGLRDAGISRGEIRSPNGDIYFGDEARLDAA